MNPYEVLGVSKETTTEEIRRTYRSLALKHHPDKGGDEEKFKQLREAYEMIDTDEKRKNLENGNTGNNNPFPFPGGFPGFPGFFGNMFANAMNQASKAKTRPIEHPLDITLEDIAKNRSINVTISTHKPCDCVDDSNCDNCGGKGTVQQVQRNGMMTMINNSSCQKCNGTGKVGKQNSSCRKC